MAKTLQRAYVTGVDHYDEVKTGVIFYEDLPNDRIDSHLYIEDLGPEMEKRWYVRGMTNHDGDRFENYADAEKFLIETSEEGYEFAASYPDLDLTESPKVLLQRSYVKGITYAYTSGPGEEGEEEIGFVYHEGEPDQIFEQNNHILDMGEDRKPGLGRFLLIIGNQQWDNDNLEELEDLLRDIHVSDQDHVIMPKYSPLELTKELDKGPRSLSGFSTPTPAEVKEDATPISSEAPEDGASPSGETKEDGTPWSPFQP
jgi:hypothetical protein